MEIFISLIIFLFIASSFLKILKDSLSTFFNFLKAKNISEKNKFKRLLLIRGGFLLPWETINLLFTFIFSFFVFHLFTSSLIFIALVSLLFKEIFSEIPYLLLCSIFYLLKKYVYLKEEPFIQKTEIIPPNFYSALYIPQKAKSITEVYAGITQGLRALRNNLKPKSKLIFIYHTDTEEDMLIEEEIRLILEAKKELGNRVFLFARNRHAFNPFFLRKPGGYMSDYQILTTGVWHPLTYISSNFDARRQKILSPKGELKEHIPFYSEENDESQYFLYYHKDLFLKEKIIIKKIYPQEEKYENIKVFSQGYLTNKENPKDYYLLSQGKILSPEGKVLYKPYQWKIDPEGRIKFMDTQKEVFENKKFDFIFVQIIYLNENKKLTLDPVANLIDLSNGEIWAKRNEYKIEFSYDLYRIKGKKFYLIKRDFPVKENFIREKDYRRLIFDRMTGISKESLKDLIREKLISFSQAEEFMERGIVGDIYTLNIGKNGMEKEYFVDEPWITLKERVYGGYLVKESAGFHLDKEGNLLFKDKIIEKKENVIETFKYEEKGVSYLIYKEKGEDFFVRFIETNERVVIDPKENYFYIFNPWINKIKISKGGFIVNEKDGFYIDEKGDLWYIGDSFERNSFSPIFVAEKEKIKELEKETFLIDDKENSFKKIKIIREAGGWYRDENNRIRLRKKISLRDFVYFDEKLNALVKNPLNGKISIYPLGSYTLGKTYLWQKISEEDKTVEENFSIKDGDLIKEEIIAGKEEISFNEEGKIILKNGKGFPYGIYLKFPNGEFLEDKNNDFIPADCGIKIVNQTDADAEFQPHTIPYLNRILIASLHEEDPYLMLQPEISFGNQDETIFARFHYWAQQMYRFTGRAIFSIYRESSAYGKMTKWVDAYVKNILFKEVIPPLARTHDHWEAIYLKTALVYSYPHLKSKNLIENTPPNYFSFLKRLEGWIGGDLFLLEYESYFGVIIDLLRAGLSLLRMKFSEIKFWLKHLFKKIEHLKEKSETPSYLLKTMRIWLIKRLSFSPFYYGVWLILVGTISLIIPGTLTIKNPQLAWFIFWSVLAILICLPKIIIPLLERIILFERKKQKLITFIFIIFLAVFLNRLGKHIFLENWDKITSLLFLLYILRYFIIYFIKSLFSLYPGIINRIGNILIFSIVSFFVWIYFPFLLNWLENIPSARWLFLFFFKHFPSFSGFLLILILLLEIIPQQRIILETIRRGIWETIYSSSILLLNIIYVSFIVFSKILFMLFNPHKTIPWFTSPFVEKIIGKKISLGESYLRLIWAPIFSLSFVILPVSLGLADPSLIFYGWPVFIWSWLFGPMLVWFSGNFGEKINFSSLLFLGIRDQIFSLEKELLKDRDKLIEKILEYNIKLNHTLNPRELLRIFLYFITEGKEETLSIDKYLDKELLPENLREYNWETLNELGRARILLKTRKTLSKREIDFIKAIVSLINLMGVKKLGFPSWEELSFSQQGKLIKRIFKKYKLSQEERREIKKLLQFFERNELGDLYKKLIKNKRDR